MQSEVSDIKQKPFLSGTKAAQKKNKNQSSTRSLSNSSKKISIYIAKITQLRLQNLYSRINVQNRFKDTADIENGLNRLSNEKGHNHYQEQKKTKNESNTPIIETSTKK